MFLNVSKKQELNRKKHEKISAVEENRSSDDHLPHLRRSEPLIRFETIQYSKLFILGLIGEDKFSNRS